MACVSTEFPIEPRRMIAAAAAMLALAGCARDEARAPGTAHAAPPRVDAAAQDARPAASTCPATTFGEFAAKFVDDQALQRRYTAVPLRMRSIDATAEPEPAPVEQQLAKEDIQYPIAPARAQRAERHLQISIDEAGPSMRLAAPDSDDQTTYRFRKDACWTLVAVESDSL